MTSPRVPIGQIVATPAALDAMARSGDDAATERGATTMTDRDHRTPSQLRAERPTDIRDHNFRHPEDASMFTLLFPDGAQLGLTATDAARLLSPGQRVLRHGDRDYLPLAEGCTLVCPMGDWRGSVGLD